MEEFSLFIEEPKEEKEEIGTGTLTRVRQNLPSFSPLSEIHHSPHSHLFHANKIFRFLPLPFFVKTLLQKFVRC